MNNLLEKHMLLLLPLLWNEHVNERMIFFIVHGCEHTKKRVGFDTDLCYFIETWCEYEKNTNVQIYLHKLNQSVKTY